jgi:hypothetical protein
VKRRVDACKQMELPEVLQTCVSGDVEGELGHCVLLMRAAREWSDPANLAHPSPVMEQAVVGTVNLVGERVRWGASRTRQRVIPSAHGQQLCITTVCALPARAASHFERHCYAEVSRWEKGPLGEGRCHALLSHPPEKQKGGVPLTLLGNIGVKSRLGVVLSAWLNV